MRVWHCLPQSWHRWTFFIGGHPATGVAHQEGLNLQVRSLDIRTENRHATPDDGGRYTLGNLQAMLLKPFCNA